MVRGHHGCWEPRPPALPSGVGVAAPRGSAVRARLAGFSKRDNECLCPRLTPTHAGLQEVCTVGQRSEGCLLPTPGQQARAHCTSALNPPLPRPVEAPGLGCPLPSSRRCLRAALPSTPCSEEATTPGRVRGQRLS